MDRQRIESESAGDVPLPGGASGPLRVLLVDDEPRVRMGLRMRLAREPWIEVAGEAATRAGATYLAAVLRPDALLLDVALRDGDGIAALAAIRAVHPRAAVIVLTIADDAATRTRALAAGAAAFVPKQAGVGPLLAALRALLNRPA